MGRCELRFFVVFNLGITDPTIVYSNTLMATLNARRAIRNGGTSEEAMTISLGGVRSGIGMVPTSVRSPCNLHCSLNDIFTGRNI